MVGGRAGPRGPTSSFSLEKRHLPTLTSAPTRPQDRSLPLDKPAWGAPGPRPTTWPEATPQEACPSSHEPDEATPAALQRDSSGDSQRATGP